MIQPQGLPPETWISKPPPDRWKGRFRLLTLIVLLVLGLLGFRLFELQVLQGGYFREMSENNRIKVRILPAIRGQILDRNGFSIASTRPAFRLLLIPEDIHNKADVLQKLATILKKDPKELEERYERYERQPPFLPRIIERDLSWETFVKTKAHLNDMPGVELEVATVRHYPYGELFGHVTGYIGEISKGQLEKNPKGIYRMGDMTGKTGLETSYETELRGRNGQRLLEVDALGRPKSILGEETPVVGNTLVTSLDIPTQMAGYLAFGPNKGAAVAIDPETGEVLALISKPSYDPNLFAVGIDRATWASLANGPGKPLINKAVTGVYPPASTFKAAVALAGLESGKIGPNSRISCGGSFWFGGRTFRCWKKGGHGGLNVVQALEQSCDVFFYSVGNWVGIDRIATYAKMLGLGMATGIDLPGERTGTIPSTAWKKRVLKVKWYPGETISCAIGQGYVTVTPLQLALFTSGLAHGQRIIAPRIGKTVRNPDTGAQIQTDDPPVRELTLSPKNLSLVQEGLLAVVEGPRGTGKRAKIQNLRVAGKTGTAQVVKLSTFKGYSPSALPERYRDHAWFIAYAPYEHPKIAVAVLVEHGEHGATTAAPVAKAMIEAYLRLVPNPISGGKHGTARSNP